MRQRICWRVNDSEYSGNKEWVMGCEDKLREEVDALNAKFPFMTHWIEDEPVANYGTDPELYSCGGAEGGCRQCGYISSGNEFWDNRSSNDGSDHEWDNSM